MPAAPAAPSAPRRRPIPALLTLGFRPFFLGAAIWAALAMALWIAALSGAPVLPSRFPPATWHAHEFLFGYLGAVIAGFLLTAVPNWVRRPPLTGWPLAGLVGAWLAGRLAIAASADLPLWLIVTASLALPMALAATLAREIVAARNWRNLIVLAALAAFGAGDAVFLCEDARGTYAAQGAGLRIGLSAAMMLVAIIGGRIVPIFTRNWLARREPGAMPSTPAPRFDAASLAALAVALVGWIVAPESVATALLLFVAAGLHLIRLGYWAGYRTAPEPLLWILHLGYLLLPLGALAVGAQILAPDLIAEPAARHLWLAGVIGVMTLAVMTRATLGHTGRPLHAGAGTVVIFLAVLVSVLARVAAGIWFDAAQRLYEISGGLWIVGFAGFAILYAPLLTRPRRDS